MSNQHTQRYIEDSYEAYAEALREEDTILWLEFERRLKYPASYHGRCTDEMMIDNLLGTYEKELDRNPEADWIPAKSIPAALPDPLPADYCEIGMSSCQCGWTGKYPISGCPRCNHSFVN